MLPSRPELDLPTLPEHAEMHPSSYGSTQYVTRNACSSNPSRPDATTLVAQRNNIIEHLQGALLPPKARYRLFPNQASPGDRVSRHLLLKYNVTNI